MTTNLTRADQVGAGPYDSIKWAFETHVKLPDTGEFNYATLIGNEDAPTSIEFYRKEPEWNDKPDWIWRPTQEGDQECLIPK